MVNIMYGCCVGSWDKFQRYVARPGRQLVALSEQVSISTAYNRIIDMALLSNVDILVLQHDDLEITDPLFEVKVTEAASEPNVALVGVAGGGPSMAWWNVNPIGHQLTDSGPLEFGQRRAGDVSVIEGSLMVLSRWALENLRFDERYEFLGYDDICLTTRGRRVVVVDVDTHHHSTVGYKSDEVRQMWERSEKIWNEKWGGS